MAEPFDLTIADAEDRIRRRELSSVTMVESLLSRIEGLEPALNAWVTIDREEVLSAARHRDNELEESGPRGPLHGIPVGLKDIFYTAGMKTTAGSRIYADFVPTYDATSVARLKEAGAIILGKAVTTEFATSDPSPSHNPWNPAHTPGGSSSGSAVAVSARMCPATLGSQTGGSTCRPASYNGVVGLKATYGRISRYGVVPVSWCLDTVGVLVRTVEDAAIMLGAMAGHDPNDPSSSAEPVPDYRGALGSLQSPPRIGLIREFFLERCDDETRRNTEDAVERLSRAGAIIEEIGLPRSFATCHAAQRIVMNVECAAFHEESFRDRADDYGPRIRSVIESGMLVPGVRYLQAQRIRRHFHDEMSAMAKGVDALLTPTTPTPAPRDLNTTGDAVFQSPWTFAGLPTVTIPSGLSQAGLPMGIQMAGPPFGEARLLAVARWCEEALGVELIPPLPASSPG
jgi:aspartyl-tRNA(Asn)/glutamyl-tRNA(Gln) amidotransferase subunit A